MPTSPKQSVSLYFKGGGSDKEYHARIEPKDGQFVVNFAYGRRGSTLQTGTKTTIPVDFQTATTIFTKLVTEKKAKGYTEGASGTPYQHTDKEERVSHILPQLLNPIEESELEKLIKDDNWCAQEKFDGRRILLHKEGATVQGINRKGLFVDLPASVIEAARRYPGNFTLDTESIGETLHVFDLLMHKGRDLRSAPYHVRVTGLINLLASGDSRHLQFAPVAWSEMEKHQLLAELRMQNREGIVFKHHDAPYVAGQPASGGSQLKHKFYATLSAVVDVVNTKRSVGLKLLTGARWVGAGNVTIPANHAIPAHGAVVEVRYLYAFRESGCLYQPQYLGTRSDVLPTECVTGQLKFKHEEE
jgi:bifunctional non-homologous end joining protein LigD